MGGCRHNVPATGGVTGDGLGEPALRFLIDATASGRTCRTHAGRNRHGPNTTTEVCLAAGSGERAGRRCGAGGGTSETQRRSLRLRNAPRRRDSATAFAKCKARRRRSPVSPVETRYSLPLVAGHREHLARARFAATGPAHRGNRLGGGRRRRVLRTVRDFGGGFRSCGGSAGVRLCRVPGRTPAVGAVCPPGRVRRCGGPVGAGHQVHPLPLDGGVAGRSTGIRRTGLRGSRNA